MLSEDLDMRMRKKRFRIGELADKLEIERFIVRFWERQFDLKTIRSYGKQRYYDERDFERFQKIKELLYQRGFTIAGARKELDSLENSKKDTNYPQKLESPTQKTKTKTTGASDLKVQASIKDLDTELPIIELKQQLTLQKQQFESQIRDLKLQLNRLKEIL